MGGPGCKSPSYLKIYNGTPISLENTTNSIFRWNRDLSTYIGNEHLKEKVGKYLETKDVPQLLLYGEIAKLGTQVQRLTDQVKPNQIKVIYFDEFVNKTDNIYYSVLEFLKVKKASL